MPRSFRLSDRLKTARIAASLSQAALAAACARAGQPIDSPRLSRLEKNYAEATATELHTLAPLLGVTPEWLAGEAETGGAAALASAPPTRRKTASRRKRPALPGRPPTASPVAKPQLEAPKLRRGRQSIKGTILIEAHVLLAADVRAATFSLRLNTYLALLLHNDQLAPITLDPEGRTERPLALASSLPAVLRRAGEQRARETGFKNFSRYAEALLRHDIMKGGPLLLLPK